MSINLFFLLVLGLLIGMYGYFKPSYPVRPNNQEIPQIELTTFALYEISGKGIDHVLEGAEGKKFADRYEITSAKFSDNTQRLFQSVSGTAILYKDNIVDVNGDVYYHREDGLDFRSREAQYNTKSAVISTQGEFKITQNANYVNGKKLEFNTRSDAVSADEIRGSYQLD